MEYILELLEYIPKFKIDKGVRYDSKHISAGFY